MTQPYLFRWFADGREAHSRVRLTEEPRIGACVYIAGNRYKIVGIEGDVITIATPEKGYREPRPAEPVD